MNEFRFSVPGAAHGPYDDRRHPDLRPPGLTRPKHQKLYVSTCSQMYSYKKCVSICLFVIHPPNSLIAFFEIDWLEAVSIHESPNRSIANP